MNIARHHALLLLTLLVSCPLPSTAADDPVEDIDGLAQQWISLERQNGLLLSNWRSQQGILEQQLSLLGREQTQLSEMLAESEQQQGAVEERRLVLLEQQTGLEQEQVLVESMLRTTLIEIQGLHPQLPPPLKLSWDALIPRLMNAELTNSERLQVMMEMLTALDDFERKVTLQRAVMTLPDGNDYQLTQVYLGLAAGWYISDDGTYAGAGKATEQGWQWEALSDSSQIAELVAMLERRRTPALVTVPMALERAP